MFHNQNCDVITEFFAAGEIFYFPEYKITQLIGRKRPVLNQKVTKFFLTKLLTLAIQRFGHAVGIADKYIPG